MDVRSVWSDGILSSTTDCKFAIIVQILHSAWTNDNTGGQSIFFLIMAAAMVGLVWTHDQSQFQVTSIPSWIFKQFLNSFGIFVFFSIFSPIQDSFAFQIEWSQREEDFVGDFSIAFSRKQLHTLRWNEHKAKQTKPKQMYRFLDHFSKIQTQSLALFHTSENW